MRKYDVVAIGELNVDVILNQIPGLPEIGKEKFAKNMNITMGSSTAIFAANVSVLGIKTAFVGMIGKDDFGRLVKDSLGGAGVDISMIIEHPTIPTGATIVLNYDEDRANVTYQGTMDVMSMNHIDVDVFGKTKHLHISSIFMQSGLRRDLLKILKIARENGATTSLDTQWDPNEIWEFDYAIILPLISVFLPNETELKLLTASKTLNEAIDKIRPYINICVIKRGNAGSLMLMKDGSQHELPAYLNPSVVDAIGAGDSFNSGFIAQYVKGRTPRECQDFGNLTGALNTTASGGTGAFESLEKIKYTVKTVFEKDIAHFV